jgi:hypothetical protein
MDGLEQDDAEEWLIMSTDFCLPKNIKFNF